MAENPRIDALVPPDGPDDMGLELHSAGREVTFGFSDMWPIDRLGELCSGPAGLGMPERCPNCASQKLLVAIDRRQQRNYFCRDCTMCWHPAFAELHRVDRETCSGCGLTTTACFERFEVRTRFLAGQWAHGYEIAEALPDGYRIRRSGSQEVLPEVFVAADVRPEGAR
jgi:ferredoxin